MGEAAIAERLAGVHREVEAAAARAGRDPTAIRLVVVAKGHPAATIRQAYACGVRRLGENRVEDAIPKQDVLHDLSDIEWHLIGTIQSRKAAQVGDRFVLIHSVDRLKIARRLDAIAAAAGRRQDVLLECNVSGEPSKTGWRLDELQRWGPAVAEMRELVLLKALRVRGLMTMAPWTEDVDVQRRAFRRLAEARRRLEDELGLPLPELSMGMSDDYRVAVEEGSTIVRIGRAVLGERE